MANSFGLCRPSSGQNIYKNLNDAVLFFSVMVSPFTVLYFFIMPAVAVLPAVSLTQILYIYIVKILKLLLVMLIGKFYMGKGKGKVILLQAGRGPEGSRKLRFPDFMTSQGGGKVVTLSTGRLYPQEMLLVIISVRG